MYSHCDRYDIAYLISRIDIYVGRYLYIYNIYIGVGIYQRVEYIPISAVGTDIYMLLLLLFSERNNSNGNN